MIHTVMYHAAGIILKWCGMRDRTELLEITAWLSSCVQPIHFTLVRDHSRPLRNIDAIKEFTDILVPHFAATLD